MGIQTQLQNLQIMNTRVLYILATVWDGLSPDIHISSDRTAIVKTISERQDFSAPKPDPLADPEDVISDYYGWVREENDNMCHTDFTLKTVYIYGEDIQYDIYP